MVDYFTTTILMCILKLFHWVIKQIKIGETRNIDTFWYADFFSIVNIISIFQVELAIHFPKEKY